MLTNNVRFYTAYFELIHFKAQLVSTNASVINIVFVIHVKLRTIISPSLVVKILT